MENNALRQAKSSPFFSLGPDGDLLAAVYALEPADFLRKLDSCQSSGELLFRKSTDSFFSKYAGLDLKFYGRDLCQLYYMHACEEAVGAQEGTPDSSQFTKNVLKLAAKMKGLIARIYSDLPSIGTTKHFFAILRLTGRFLSPGSKSEAACSLPWI